MASAAENLAAKAKSRAAAERARVRANSDGFKRARRLLGYRADCTEETTLRLLVRDLETYTARASSLHAAVRRAAASRAGAAQADKLDLTMLVHIAAARRKEARRDPAA